MKRLFYLTALAAVLTLLAGCGKGGSDTAAAPAPGAAETAHLSGAAPLQPAANATVAMQPGADVEPPVIEGVEDFTVPARPGSAGARVDLPVPTVTDNLDPNPTVSSNAPRVFPMGQTTVTWTATDAAGNSATAEQVVTVTAQYPPPGGPAH